MNALMLRKAIEGQHGAEVDLRHVHYLLNADLESSVRRKDEFELFKLTGLTHAIGRCRWTAIRQQESHDFPEGPGHKRPAVGHVIGREVGASEDAHAHVVLAGVA